MQPGSRFHDRFSSDIDCIGLREGIGVSCVSVPARQVSGKSPQTIHRNCTQMPKPLGCLFKLFLSGLLFILIGVLTVLARQYLSIETYSGTDHPHPQFRILLGANDGEDSETGVRAVRLTDYRKQVDRYKIYRSPEENGMSIGPLWYQVQQLVPGKQLIKLRYSPEHLSLYNEYHVINDQIVPLYFRISDRGDAVLGFLVSIVLTPIVLVSFRFVRRRYEMRKNY